jgi:hypothetical protein
MHIHIYQHPSGDEEKDGEEFVPIFLERWVRAAAEEYTYQGYDDEDEEIDVDMHHSQNLSWCTFSALCRIRRTTVIDSELDSLEFSSRRAISAMRIPFCSFWTKQPNVVF